MNLKILKNNEREYIDQLKKEGKQNIISILNMNPISLDENNNVIFTVANEMNRMRNKYRKRKITSLSS